MDSKAIQVVSSRSTNSEVDWEEWLRVDSMSSGVYRLKAGASDPQQPHQEDELYVCLGGKAKLIVENETFEISFGTSVFVAAHRQHRFTEVEEDLVLMVVFAPPESQNR